MMAPLSSSASLTFWLTLTWDGLVIEDLLGEGRLANPTNTYDGDHHDVVVNLLSCLHNLGHTCSCVFFDLVPNHSRPVELP